MSGKAVDIPGSLRMQRALIGMTVKRVASDLNVSERTLRSWESGEHEISLTKALALCKLYGITISELVGGESMQDSSDELIKALEGILEALRGRAANS